ncbi:hypothetical protein J2W40_001710 [Sphingobium xenophagum]|uniref:Uncharacterized protein n=1 Tax=Sphingobium xenophagum TaxID=121428 RepID=A0ABU1X1G1_SPHXE|nr:hypothetical protein [Sphingobium xenophagum]
MTHKVDVSGVDTDGILVGNRVTHNDVNTMIGPMALGVCTAERAIGRPGKNLPSRSFSYAALQQMTLT